MKDKGITFNNKYEQIKLLGEGSFGKAFLVECIEDKSLAVIKTIDLVAMSEEEKKEAILEAKILEQLNHPNIIKFKEVFVEKKTKLNIVMDYADGGDLQQKIRAMKNIKYFQETQIIDWFTQTCLAIKHIHDRKILHRDVKSQNIFLTRHGLVKLGDFGIAKCLDLTMDKVKTIVGTPYYLSPELLSNKPYSFKNDIWALGVLLYEMCCLKMPFEAPNLPLLSLKILRCNYNPIPDKYSKELKNLISLCLNVDPNKRPSVKEILKYPLIASRINKFLSEIEFKDEFSHTIMHKYNALKLPSSVEISLSNQYAINKRIDSTPKEQDYYNKHGQKPIIKNDKEKEKKVEKKQYEINKEIRESQGHLKDNLNINNIVNPPNVINKKIEKKETKDSKKNSGGLKHSSEISNIIKNEKRAREKSGMKIDVKKKIQDNRDLLKRESNSSAQNQKRSDSRGSGAEEDKSDFSRYLKEMNSKYKVGKVSDIIKPSNQINSKPNEKADKEIPFINKYMNKLDKNIIQGHEKEYVSSNTPISTNMTSNEDIKIENNIKLNFNAGAKNGKDKVEDYDYIEALKMCVLLKNLENEKEENDDYFETNQDEDNLIKEFDGMSQDLIDYENLEDNYDEVDHYKTDYQIMKNKLIKIFGEERFNIIYNILKNELKGFSFDYDKLTIMIKDSLEDKYLSHENKSQVLNNFISRIPDLYSIVISDN